MEEINFDEIGKCKECGNYVSMLYDGYCKDCAPKHRQAFEKY